MLTDAGHARYVAEYSDNFQISCECTPSHMPSFFFLPSNVDRRVSRNSMNAELETDLLSAKLPVMEPGARSFSKLHVTLTDARVSLNFQDPCSGLPCTLLVGSLTSFPLLLA